MDVSCRYYPHFVQSHWQVGKFQQGQHEIHNVLQTHRQPFFTSMRPHRIEYWDTKIMTLTWPLKNCQEIFLWQVKLKSELFLIKMNLHIFLRRRKTEKVGTKPNLPASSIICLLGCKPKAKLEQSQFYIWNFCFVFNRFCSCHHSATRYTANEIKLASQL